MRIRTSTASLSYRKYLYFYKRKRTFLIFNMFPFYVKKTAIILDFFVEYMNIFETVLHFDLNIQ